ncbi:MAG: hypothetical protein Q9227_001431 [Pyrenula ochraceoflavens]
MTTIQQPPVPASNRRKNEPGTLKLRDSCHNCAASKLKCSKEKPTCARCMKRGKVCEYFATRRVGRKQGNRSNNPSLSTQAEGASTTSTTSKDNEINETDTIEALLNQYAPPGYSDTLPSPLFPTEPPPVQPTLPFLNSTPADFNIDFDNYFTSPISLSILDGLDDPTYQDSHLETNITTPFPDNAFPISDDLSTASTKFTSPSEVEKTLTDQASLTNLAGQISPIENPQSSMDIVSDSHCGCLLQALSLLKQLSPNASRRCTAQLSRGYENSRSHLRPLQVVIADNEQTIKVISSMLSCPCAQDGYLLAIMSLIVFKVLGWYAAAARETTESEEGHVSASSSNNALHHLGHDLQASGSYYIESEDQGRMAAQLVLSELHRVQRLVNTLSIRLKDHKAWNQEDGKSRSVVADKWDKLGRAENDFPFSPTLLDQLEMDLRKRLRTLSSDIVNILRHT